MFQTRGPSSVIIQLCLLKHTCMCRCVSIICHIYVHLTVFTPKLHVVSQNTYCAIFLSLLPILPLRLHHHILLLAFSLLIIYYHTLLLNIFTMAINILVTCIEKLQVQHACEYGLLSSVRTHELPISPPPPLIIFLHQHLLFLHSSIHMLQTVW